MRIALVIPYFGKFNNYFDFWCKTAENNPDVDFLLFTDQEQEENSNIKIVRTTLPSVVDLIQQKCQKYDIPATNIEGENVAIQAMRF